MKLHVLIRTLVSSLMASVGLTSCASELPLAPFANPQKVGSLVSQTIHVQRESGWTVHLRFTLPKGLAKNDPRVVRLERLLEEVTGGSATPLKPHKGIRLLLTVVQRIDGRDVQVRQKTVTEEHMHTSNEIYVDGFRLLPGEYVVTLQTLDEDTRLDGVDIVVSVGTKPFTY